MFQENTKLHVPPDDTLVWKYMDLSKFLDILLSEKMFMSRSDKFEDQYEGTFSEPTYEEIKKLLKDNFIVRYLLVCNSYHEVNAIFM